MYSVQLYSMQCFLCTYFALNLWSYLLTGHRGVQIILYADNLFINNIIGTAVQDSQRVKAKNFKALVPTFFINSITQA